MKIKSLIKLICLLVVVACFSIWAFGANVLLFETRFLAWDESMLKGNDIGMSNVTVYTVKAPDNVENFDVHAAALNAVKVLEKRAELMSYEGAVVKSMGKDKVYVALPLSEAQIKGGLELFEQNGALTVTHEGSTVFTNKDIKSAKITGVNEDYTAYLMEVTLNNDAKAKLQELTSDGANQFAFSLDKDAVKATFSSTETVTNGKMTLEFNTSDVNNMTIMDYCLNSGAIEGTITATSSYVATGSAGNNGWFVLAMGALAILVLATVYFVISKRMLGVAAALSLLIAVLGIEFFAATFTWLLVDAGAIAGLFVGILASVIMLVAVMEKIQSQYALGKDLVSAVDGAIVNGRGLILEFAVVAIVIGLGFWIAGFASFGIAVAGGVAIAAIVAVFILKFIAKIFIGLGASTGKAFGLKRGE